MKDSSSESRILKAAAYLRLSRSDGDRIESNSISAQRLMIKEFARRRDDMDIVAEYSDDGYTGTNFDRPAFTEMLADIKRGMIDCVIVKDLSRFGRNYIESGRYLEQIFPILGIRFISVLDSFDTENDRYCTDIIMPLKNLLNDAYSRDLSIKIRSQLATKQREGRFIGSFAPFGYTRSAKDNNKLVPDSVAANTVNAIFRAKSHGASSNAIAREMNLLGIPVPSEYKRLCGMNFTNGFKCGTFPKWSSQQINRILRSEVYVGTSVQGINRKPDHRTRSVKVSDELHVKKENAHIPIVSSELFDKVQKIMSDDRCKNYLNSGYSNTNYSSKDIYGIFAECAAGMIELKLRRYGSLRERLKSDPIVGTAEKKALGEIYDQKIEAAAKSLSILRKR